MFGLMGAANQKQKISVNQNSIIEGRQFFEKCRNLQKQFHPWGPCPCNPNCGFRLKFKNLFSLFCLTCQMLSKMVCNSHVASMTMEEIDYRITAWILTKSLQVGTGQWYYCDRSFLLKVLVCKIGFCGSLQYLYSKTFIASNHYEMQNLVRQLGWMQVPVTIFFTKQSLQLSG